MSPLEQVQQAFLQLSWAIKLSSFLQKHLPTNKVDFDHFHSVDDPDDPDGCICLPDDQFNSINDIYLGAENAILRSVGDLFLAFDTALGEAGKKNDPSAQDSFGQLRILIYMSRCSFAHNVLAPCWEVRGKYRRQIEIKLTDISLQLDLRELADKPFDIKQIGGYLQLFKIKDYIIQILTPNQAMKADGINAGGN
ncbi:hypothetical protein [Desulfobacula sp.]|uniref:hypothetical protein n=1 Tax=Desulfobacula sp. TaxID=2593537 RepID=UPI002625B273|nr:hypothetical protein [Desulfobacula sp.]